jgi:hypothetical protein
VGAIGAGPRVGSGDGMKWRVLIELTGPDGSVRLEQVMASGGRPVDPLADSPIGLTLAEGKTILATVQARLVDAQAAAYCAARRRCGHCAAARALKGWRRRRLVTLFGRVELRAPLFKPCRCGVASRRHLSPLSEIMPDRCTAEFDRMVARLGSLVAYGRVPALMAEFLPIGRLVATETARQRTLRIGARLEPVSLTADPPPPSKPAGSMTLCVEGGYAKSIPSYHDRSFEILVAHAKNDQGRERLFSTVSPARDGEWAQLNTVLRELGATPTTPVTIVSDGDDSPRVLGEKSSPGPTRHVLDWYHLAMRLQHGVQTVKSWPCATEADRRGGARLADCLEHLRWRLHGQGQRAVDLIGEMLSELDRSAAEPCACRLLAHLKDFEGYVVSQSASLIDYGAAQRSAPSLERAQRKRGPTRAPSANERQAAHAVVTPRRRSNAQGAHRRLERNVGSRPPRRQSVSTLSIPP